MPVAPLHDRYRACMLLSGAGDALGYGASRWEYCESGRQIVDELAGLGGLSRLRLAPPTWPVSDDTVLHLATAEALARHSERVDAQAKEVLFHKMAAGYVAAMLDMEGRKPGPTSILGTSQLRPGRPGGFRVPFNPNATGCGAAMRAMCIGLRFPREEQLDDLVEVSLASGKMTHNHPTGYLGAVASALLVSCAVRRDPVESWGRTLTLRALPVARRLALDGPDAEREVEHWGQFVTVWERYLLERNIAEDTATTSATDTTASTASRAMFPESLGTPEGRDEAYRAWSLDGWAGRSGHDAPMIAYDAVLRAAPSMERRTSEGEPEGTAQGWELLCNYGMFHGGDSDSTGVIAGACWGALWGLEGVPVGNSEHLEYHDRLIHAADSLYRLAWPHTAAE